MPKGQVSPGDINPQQHLSRGVLFISGHPYRLNPAIHFGPCTFWHSVGILLLDWANNSDHGRRLVDPTRVSLSILVQCRNAPNLTSSQCLLSICHTFEQRGLWVVEGGRPVACSLGFDFIETPKLTCGYSLWSESLLHTPERLL